MPTFRLVAGKHVQGRDKEGKPRFYKAGQLVESTVDLVKRFGKEKFQYVSREEAGAIATAVADQTELESLSIRELREYAESEEIDIGGLTKKNAIIKVILQRGD